MGYKNVKNAVSSGKITELEGTVIDWFLKNGLYADDEPDFSDVSVEDISTVLKLDMAVVKGVIGSLTKKDYLWVSDHGGEVGNVIYATEKGFGLMDDFKERYPNY